MKKEYTLNVNDLPRHTHEINADGQINIETNDYLNLVENDCLIPYKCVHANDNEITIARLRFSLNEHNKPVEAGIDENSKLTFLK